MTLVLEVSKLAERDRPSEGDVARGRVDAQLDPQGAALANSLGELLLAYDVLRTAYEALELLRR